MSTDTEWKQNGSLQAATLPTQYELPCEDVENLESERHKLQMDLLFYRLRAWLSRRRDDSGTTRLPSRRRSTLGDAARSGCRPAIHAESEILSRQRPGCGVVLQGIGLQQGSRFAEE